MIQTSRRELLVGSLAAVAAAALPRPAGAARPATRVGLPRARVVLVEDARATYSTTRIDGAVVTRMVEQAVRAFVGVPAPRPALAGLFHPGEKVAIKVNAFAYPCSMVNPVTALTLARLLIEAGVRRSDIRIYDQYASRLRGAGYRLGKPRDGIWITDHDGADPAVQRFQANGWHVDFHWARALVWADALINVCVPKDHDLTGVTGALKNVAFGSVRPTAARERRPNGYTVVPAFHRDHCDPAIAWLYSQPMIRDKVRLVVCDAVRVLYQGGPKDNERHRARNNQLLVSADPVALDRLLVEIVDRHRVQHGLRPIAMTRPARPPTFIETAARLGLGEGDRAKIELERRRLA